MTKQRIIDCDWLYSEWHPKKNVGLDPAKITVESEQVVWWHLEYTDPKLELHIILNGKQR